jgi:hypothetical protein
MIDAVKFREMVEAWEATRRKCESGFRERELLYWFMLSHASELLALAEADTARRRKALDELIAMDADLYDDPPESKL